MSRAKARSILKGLVSEGEQEELILFLEYKVEEDFDLDELCEQLEEDFALPHSKTRQLIGALGGKLNAPRVISKPRAFPGGKKQEDSSSTAVSPPPTTTRPVRGRGTRGRARGRRGRGRGRRGRGARARGLRPVVSFPSTNQPEEDDRPTEKAEPPSPDTTEEVVHPKKEQPKEIKKPAAPSRPKVIQQEDEAEDTSCFICAEESEYWAIANCGHSCCARCAVKYRWTFNWLGKARIKKKPICPWCRQPWKRIFIGKQGLKLEDFDRSLPFDKQLKVTYQTRQERAHFHKLLEMRCPICDEPHGGYQSLDGLQNHMRDKHNSYLCTLCLDNTTKFLDEHEVYESKEALKKHKKKVHPQCNMCYTFFYNQDILDAHQKNEHPTCPGKDCTELVFRNMNEARGHFRTAHYLCELDGCAHLRQPQLFLDKAEYQRHVFDHTQCIPARPAVKKRKAKRRPRTVEGNAVAPRLERMGYIIQTSLLPELVIYHQLLFSTDIDSQLLFKSFRVCWESQVEFDVWEQFWLYYISTLSDPNRQSELFNLYRAYCHDPAFDRSIQRWSPANQNNVSNTQPRRFAPMNFSIDIEPALSSGPARPKPASSRNVTQPASREILYGAWGGRGGRTKMQPRTIPKPTSRGNQPALKGAWARRSGGGSGANPIPFPVEASSPQKSKKKKKKKKKKNL